MSEPKFKRVTQGFKHVVFTYGKGMKQGNWREHLQSLSGIAANSTKYGRAFLAQAIRTMKFQDKPKLSDTGENVLTLLKKKYKRACEKWVKVKEEVE